MAATNYSAVTAACMLLRKSLFEQVGGLQEEDLPVQFNDVDLCLRIRERGYHVVYTPYAELYHHESVSRGHFSGNRTENLWMRERWGPVMDNDPCYNPNFSRAYGDFNLRADLMRPRILRQEAELEDPPNWAANPLEHQRHREDQHFIIRSSSRTTLIPKRTNDTAEALPTAAHNTHTRSGGHLEEESRPSA
jgi:cellulose synthase/poly-beta-1,6-N-acetylglucosamine synthase-like glycosyltransferase